MLPYAADMERGSWRSADYVEAWASDDVLDEVLTAPRRLTAALVAETGSEVAHVVDLGAGTGAYLAELLDAFPAARGTWVDASERMEELARKRFGERVHYVLGDVSEL